MRAEAGAVIGGYELVRKVGRGGMAEVWVARKALGKKGSKFVAIKLIADHYVGDERYLRMFRSEAELAALLSHANIVQVFDEGEDEGRSYLVMEWVDGINLLKLGDMLALIDDDQRRFQIITYIIGQLLHALHYAHSITSYDGSPLGVVHRDVSPQNVLVSNHGEVKLTDFGVAYYNVEQSSGIHVKGKVRYMSPEQIGGKTRSPTVDLFAVGALLHELLDGKKFRSDYDDGQELFAAVIAGEVPPLSRPAPRELDELRLRLLASDPAERIQTAEEAIAWLQRYPGYGDARPELTKLCSSLTGVVRPRAGPGQSSQVPMADQRTAQFSGKGLAKPRVNPESMRPEPALPARPAAKPAMLGQAMATSSSSITTLEGQRHGATPPVVTGQTEFIKPQQPAGPGKKQVFGGPSAPPPVPPRAAAYGAAPARAPMPVASPGPTPLHAVSLEHDPYAAANAVPHPVIEQRSHPIAVPLPAPAMPMMAPTERLGLSETSGARANATEAIDASMFVEQTAGSGTDRDAYPAYAVQEGSDTSREIHPQGVPPSHSIAIPVANPNRGSAIALLVVGLLLVAVASVGITWWLFTRNKEDNRVAAAGDVAAPASTTKEPTEPPPPAATKEPVPEPKAKAVTPAPAPEPEPDAEVVVEEDGDASTGQSAEVEPADAAPDEQDEVADSPPQRERRTEEEPEPSEGDEPPPKEQEAPKATVILTALPSITAGEVIIGGAKLAIAKGQTVKKKLSAGKKKVEWRTDPLMALKPSKAVVLQPGKTTKIQLTFTGPREIP